MFHHACQRWNLRDTRRIFVLRALYLGDMLCAVPALRALRTAAPRAEIVLAGLPWARELAERYATYIDAFVEFPGFPGLTEQKFDSRVVVEFLARLQHERFDLAIQMHGSGINTNALIQLVGAPRTAGFYAADHHCPDASSFLPYPIDKHEIWRHLSLMELLGASPRGDQLEFPLNDNDYQRLHSLAGARSLDDTPYICLHVGAKLPSRRWPLDRFVAVANALGKSGHPIVLTGSSAERELVAKVEQALNVPCVNLCGQTDLGMLAALVRQARLLISNDTGVAHIAAAVRTPSVVIVLSSDPKRWAPLDRRRHRVVMNPIDCRPCEHADCPIGFTCAKQTSTSDVLAAAREQLTRWALARRTGIDVGSQPAPMPDACLASSIG